jgi:hypothetical protein
MASTSRRPVRLAVAIALAVAAGTGCTGGARTNGAPPESAPASGARTNGAPPAGAAPSNGLEKRSAAQVQKEVGAALKKAGSVHVTVTGSDSGRLPQLDLRIQGGASTGAMGLGGVQYQITTIGGDTYVKGDQRVWEAFGAPAAAKGRLAGRWVKVRPQQFASLAAFSLDSLAAGLTRNDSRLVGKVERATLDGRKVLVLRKRDGSRIYVANTGPAYPLRTEGKGPNPVRIDFSEYGVDFHITTPGDVVDFDTVA